MVAVGMGSGEGDWALESGPRATASDRATVSRVIDGDTIVVAGDRRVRLIGIDAPEPTDCYGPEATALLRQLLPGGSAVRLEYDEEREDSFGRTLAYVYRAGEDRSVNELLAGDGAARDLVVSPNLAHVEDILLAVAEAQAAGNGLWTACAGAGAGGGAAAAGSATTTPSATTAPVPSTMTTAAPSTASTAPSSPAATRAATTTAAAPATTAAAANCHPSYSGACVPVGVSDVDCAGGGGNGPAYVSAKRFRVVGPDEYGLDSDNDGIACET